MKLKLTTKTKSDINKIVICEGVEVQKRELFFFFNKFFKKGINEICACIHKSLLGTWKEKKKNR